MRADRFRSHEFRQVLRSFIHILDSRKLPEKRLKEVLLFAEFLEHLAETGQEEAESEDADLWAAVLAHATYKESHLEETPEILDSPEAFLKATADL